MDWTFPFSLPGLSDDEKMPYDANMAALSAGDKLGFESQLDSPPATIPVSYSAPSAPAPSMPAPDYTNPARQARLAEIGKALDALKVSQASNIADSVSAPKMTGDQALITAIGAMLPMILGRAIAGNAGGAIGGQAGSTFATLADKGYDEINKEKQAKALKQYEEGKLEQTKLTDEQKALLSQGFQAADSRQLEGMKEKNRDENALEAFGRQKDLNKLRQEAADDRADERQKGATERNDEIASRPYNRDISSQQTNARKLIDQGKSIIDLASKLDPDGKESVAGALERGVKAGLFKDSTEADLQREQMQFVFSSLKSFFPGAISDQEREAATKALGGEKGVPLRTVANIMRKAISRAVSQANENLSADTEAGYKMRFKPLVDPFGSVDQQSGADTSPLSQEERQRLNELRQKYGGQQQ